jgi:hypothetical protein
VCPIDESAWRYCKSSVWHDGIGLALFHIGIFRTPDPVCGSIFALIHDMLDHTACWILNWQGLVRNCSHLQLQVHCRAKFSCRGMGVAQEPRFADLRTCILAIVRHVFFAFPPSNAAAGGGSNIMIGVTNDLKWGL